MEQPLGYPLGLGWLCCHCMSSPEPDRARLQGLGQTDWKKAKHILVCCIKRSQTVQGSEPSSEWKHNQVLIPGLSLCSRLTVGKFQQL